MRGRIVVSGLVVAATMLSPAAVAEARDPECDVILPAADRIEQSLDLLSLGADMPPNAGSRIQTSASLLSGLTSPAAVDLRLRASTVADHVNGTNPYRDASLADDLMLARQQLIASRQSCAGG
ncbi:hypothetical protein H7J07_08815 [Mycobacterium koreense]|uniref:Uncharacterized protein n=1 Tax=Mycolicibacillus koreensis TaxID=1069220 RepID=A0A7I7SER4_9MYCO|nr:hypothetical protein [Mycolicibacillus koreensis]MCV7248320.1 hypothetical protein [Mycolicibacillus koreensis]OSC33750.1 hypothetical protein B8W67_09445 [Mycolicibacillus koreensis]BBY55258.1 hypothetical protein MKOR_25090 [Mycolicibacillus koreensis]